MHTALNTLVPLIHCVRACCSVVLSSCLQLKFPLQTSVFVMANKDLQSARALDDCPATSEASDTRKIESTPSLCLPRNVLKYKEYFSVYLIVSNNWRKSKGLRKKDIIDLMTKNSVFYLVNRNTSVDKCEICKAAPVTIGSSTNPRDTMTVDNKGQENYTFDKCHVNCSSTLQHFNSSLQLEVNLPELQVHILSQPFRILARSHNTKKLDSIDNRGTTFEPSKHEESKTNLVQTMDTFVGDSIVTSMADAANMIQQYAVHHTNIANRTAETTFHNPDYQGSKQIVKAVTVWSTSLHYEIFSTLVDRLGEIFKFFPGVESYSLSRDTKYSVVCTVLRFNVAQLPEPLILNLYRSMEKRYFENALSGVPNALQSNILETNKALYVFIKY